MVKTALEILSEIKAFGEFCKKQENFMGFNVAISKHPGKSYILAKFYDTPKAKAVLPIDLDYFDPVQHQMIDNAIHQGLYGRNMTPEESERSMVSREDEIFEDISSKSTNLIVTH